MFKISLYLYKDDVNWAAIPSPIRTTVDHLRSEQPPTTTDLDHCRSEPSPITSERVFWSFTNISFKSQSYIL
ncbi:hypothetical protein L6452_30639 [Arctium lappa]|uniref:Uncharacterized protein n=1 Tax=Arctium lappa TaxID=4217 RepID=A0ACB8ZJ63_ARCLA|nr:hypothetical protein L6452_30639 [Arctium lappa]